MADGEHLPFPTRSFDLVFAHGVVQYTAEPRLVAECRRVLKPGGEAIFQVYNRISWLNALSKLMKVDLEHEDAPVLSKLSIPEFTGLLLQLLYESCRSVFRSSRGCIEAGRGRSSIPC